MYFTLDPLTGEQYGPVEVSELLQWFREGLIQKDTVLIDQKTGAQILAQQVPELTYTMETENPVAADYERFEKPVIPGTPQYDEPNADPTLNQESIIMWVMTILSFFACPFFGNLIAISYASKLKQAGHASGGIGFLINALVLTLLIFAVIAISFNSDTPSGIGNRSNYYSP